MMSKILHIEIKNWQEFVKELNENKFARIPANDVHSDSYSTEPKCEYLKPTEFPNCCAFHKSIYDETAKWIQNFPNCCEIHRSLITKKWFKKENYLNIPQKVVDQVSFSEFYIAENISKDSWFENITDYIDYNIDSFGIPDIGCNFYTHSLNHYLKNTEWSEELFPSWKKNQLLEYTDNKSNFSDKFRPKFSDLNKTFKKWIQLFPKLEAFNEVVNKIEQNSPLTHFLYEPRYNKHTNLTKYKTRTKKELVDYLINLSKILLSTFDSANYHKSSTQKELLGYEISILSEEHRIKQEELVNKYKQEEIKYVKIFKAWLNNEKEYIRELGPLLKTATLQQINHVSIVDRSSTVLPELSSNKVDANSLPTVVILTAIKEEFKAVIDHLLMPIEIKNNDTYYHRGTFEFESQQIANVIVRECGTNNVNASQETERAIQYFRPQMILFVGIAGSRKPNDFSIGDVIFPTKIYSYEAGKSSKELFSARPNLSSPSFSLEELAKNERNKNDWKKLISELDNTNIKADLGFIASGEQLIEHYNSHIGKIITEHYNDTSAVEMEGFGFAHSAFRQGKDTNNIQVGVIRGISDILGNEDYETETNFNKRPSNTKILASKTAAAFAYWLIYKFYKL